MLYLPVAYTVMWRREITDKVHILNQHFCNSWIFTTCVIYLIRKSELLKINCIFASCCYPKTGFTSWWVLSQQTQPSQRLREGRIYYYLQQVRRTLGIFPKAVSPQHQEWGSFKLRVWNQAGPCGTPGHGSLFCVPHFLFAGNSL